MLAATYGVRPRGGRKLGPRRGSTQARPAPCSATRACRSEASQVGKPSDLEPVCASRGSRQANARSPKRSSPPSRCDRDARGRPNSQTRWLDSGESSPPLPLIMPTANCCGRRRRSLQSWPSSLQILRSALHSSVAWLRTWARSGTLRVFCRAASTRSPSSAASALANPLPSAGQQEWRWPSSRADQSRPGDRWGRGHSL